jgi:DNA-binding MarR family transcriptional regulator
MMRNRTKPVKTFAAVDGVAETNVLFELWRVSRAAGALVMERALADSGLSGDEFGVYSLLASNEEVTPSVLERWMAAPATTVSSYIKRLESRGHVEREMHSADRRSVVLKLTPAGVRAHANATNNYLPVLARVVEHLGASEPRVMKALEDLRAAIVAAKGASR